MSVASETASAAGEAAPIAISQALGRDDTRFHRYVILAIVAALCLLPLALYPIFLMKVLCFALFGLAFNLLLGYGGLLSFGHAAYFGVAGYVSAHAAKVWGLNPEFAILAGVAASAALGFAFGALAIRRQGIYFAMITLALAQMVYFFSLQAKFTGGEDGIQGVPRGHLFGLVDLADDRALYVVVAVIFMAGLLLIYRIIYSPFGQVLKSIRDNEPRAVSLGYRVNRYKLAVFTLSAALAGLAGGTKALVFQLASLTDVHWSMSGEVVLITLVGGMGTIFGPIAGAFVIVAMESYLAPFGAWVTIIQGLVFVTCVIVFRDGIVGMLSRWIRRPL
jgi:branched-chain amino acid transport system permease protein